MGGFAFLALVWPLAAAAAPPGKGSADDVRFFPAQLAWHGTLGAPPAGPAVSDGTRLFAALRTGSVVALSLENGAPIWSARVEVRGPLATDGTHVVVATADAVEALHPATGSALWRTPFADGSAVGVIATGGWVFVTGQTTVAAFNAASGERVWEQALGATARAAPFVDGDRLYVGTQDGHVLALRVKDGSRLWAVPLEGETAGIVADPDRVYLGTRGKMFYSLRAKDGSVDWRWRVGAEVAGAPLLGRDHVFMMAFDNVLRAFDRKNGAARWRVPLASRPLGPPTLVGAAILAPYLAPEVRAFGPDGRDQGHFPLDRELSGPALVTPRPYSDGGPLVVAVLSDGVTVAMRSRVEAPLAPLETLPGVAIPLEAPTTPTPGS